MHPRLMLILALGLPLATPADAQWCAHVLGSANCGFQTFEQCQANVAGVGGNCQRDPQARSGRGAERAAPGQPAPDTSLTWCAHTLGGVNCGFRTYQQCLSNVSGVGGSCQRNTQ